MTHDCWNYHGVGVYDWIGLAFPSIYLLYTHTHMYQTILLAMSYIKDMV